MAMEYGRQLEGVAHRNPRAPRPGKHAGITDLAAGLGVERRPVEQNDDFVALPRRLHRLAAAQQRDHRAARLVQGLVTKEFGWRERSDQLRRQTRHPGELAGAARPLALLLHQALVLRHRVRRRLRAAFAQNVKDQVRRAAIGVVELEQLFAVDATAARGERTLEPLHAGLERLREGALLGLERLLDQGALGRQFRIRVAHHFHQRLDHAPEQAIGLQRAQLPDVADGAADDAAQHVATALVGGQHAVHDEETAGADVVGDHPQRLGVEIGGFRELRRAPDQVLEQVDLVVAVHVLQHRRDALQAHAGVHAGRRQRQQAAVRLAVELHEDVVPDLDEAVAVFVRRARRATRDVRAVVVEDLAAGAAGTGVGHLPEIVRGVGRALVVADADDAFGGQADDLVPDVEGFVVGVIDGDQQAFLGQAPDLRSAAPRPRRSRPA